MSDFVQIRACANAVEAEQIRGFLEERGVSAFVDGAMTPTALSHVGVALGGVRVLVRACDAERAREIVESADDLSEVSSTSARRRDLPCAGRSRCALPAALFRDATRLPGGA
jgi:hypothetical protein